jgi:hypothetical protein
MTHLQSSKLRDFLVLCNASNIISEKLHLTEKGLQELKIIKSGMYSGRLWGWG